MSEQQDAVARTSAALDLAREHLAGRHAEVYVEACIECDRYRITEELKRLRHNFDEAHAVLGAWERMGEAIAHHIPEHYEAGEGSFMGMIQDWAGHAAAVVDRAQAWRKHGRGPVDSDLLDDAVEKIYPSEDYL